LLFRPRCYFFLFTGSWLAQKYWSCSE
jgi:hypothetical protein